MVETTRREIAAAFEGTSDNSFSFEDQNELS